MAELTKEQRAAVESRGKVIVSASAGSGKTFVMIQKLVNAIADGADLDDVLAVTFTKKAAAQMKEKLRTALVKRLEGADAVLSARIKTQLAKVPSANISTIHSFCSRLLRTYFYLLDIDGGFEIISSDDAVARDLKSKAIDGLFEMLYKEDSADLKTLLGCYMKKRSDFTLKRLLDGAYSEVRSTAYYGEILRNCEKLYCKEGFSAVCEEYTKFVRKDFDSLICAVQSFETQFETTANTETYKKLFDEMKSALKERADGGIFVGKKSLTVTRKPSDPEEDREAGEAFKAFRDSVTKRYNALCGDFADEETEFAAYLKSGETACAFSRVLLAFDEAYNAVKREENKLDYNDLEHLSLRLLAGKAENAEFAAVREEIGNKYKYVFVDEYQDVNPVQEEIISALRGEVFLVGDVKQAIYGFRGSRSLFFAEKYASFMGGGGTALRLSNNFRSSDGVLGFANRLFSEVMRSEVCGYDYSENSVMLRGGGYPTGYGTAKICVFGKDEKEKREPGVYSVTGDSGKMKHTREGLAALALVEKILSEKHYDLNTGKFIDTLPSDICILTRKNRGGSAEGIVRALRDGGYAVSGAGEGNICVLPEVKQFLDILSYIDNEEQDIPLVTALLSPLGGMSEDELAFIRIAAKENRLSVENKSAAFRDCCKSYAAVVRDGISLKLTRFYEKLGRIRDLSEILNTGALADELLERYGLEAVYGAGGGEKLKNVLRLVSEGSALPLAAFLGKVKAGGYDISAPASAPSESIKIMTMHAAKGLEFPVVILADINRTFKGSEYSEMPFDEEFGFTPKCFDKENMITRGTVLRKLRKMRADSEELKNELNLFYVACTRAMCDLYVLTEEIPEFDCTAVSEAKSYADTFDMQKFAPEEIFPAAEFEADCTDGENEEYSAELADETEKRFMRPYEHADSIDLPVKSSASAIIKNQGEETYFAEHRLFEGEGETGTERGTAYHRFLELCDFALREREEIERELDKFLQNGSITEEQFKLLDAAELEQILSMSVFDGLSKSKLYREREFLCRLPANEIFDGISSTVPVLIQGAIDLFAEGDFGIKIIDYKYSAKSDEELVLKYSRQLELYRKAAAKITGTDPEKIGAVIVNIYRKSLIVL